ncbi:DEAD/DEAH box helicase [Anaerorhabdus sp.]|uniref:DEAD/DEAH box helicase n=1 Tax=Anaerorhabdus sp. TaxID=1872524 RepID=UPI002FC6ECA5
MKFNTLDINESILKAIEEKGYTEPTPIQEKAIPHALLGKDILGCAQTGTGKTAAFLVPTIQRLKKHDATKIRSLILTPTRELAIQIEENFIEYSKYTNIKSAIIFGGVPQRPQERILRQGVDIVVATPGRLLDLMKQKVISIKDIEVFILDEADRMLDMGFLVDVKKIIAALPQKKQTLFFSATMPKEIKELTQTLLHEPVIIEVTPPSTTVENIQQSLYYVDKANKKDLLLDILKKNKIDSALVFTRTKNNANRLGKFLAAAHIKVGIIHGNKSQSARQIALSQFKNGDIKVLVATDIAARGIDINELSYVFNYDIPTEAEAYVHRIGRTGRAGNDGISISFADIDEIDLVKSIQKLIKLSIPVVEEHRYPMLVLQPTPKKKGKGSSPKSKTARPVRGKTSRDKKSDDTSKKTKERSDTKDTTDRRAKKFDSDTSERKPYQRKRTTDSSVKTRDTKDSSEYKGSRESKPRKFDSSKSEYKPYAKKKTSESGLKSRDTKDSTEYKGNKENKTRKFASGKGDYKPYAKKKTSEYGMKNKEIKEGTGFKGTKDTKTSKFDSVKSEFKPYQNKKSTNSFGKSNGNQTNPKQNRQSKQGARGR